MHWMKCIDAPNQNSKTELIIIHKQPRKEYNDYITINFQKSNAECRIASTCLDEMIVRCWNFGISFQTGQNSDNRIWLDILWHINSSAFRFYCRNQIVAAHLPAVQKLESILRGKQFKLEIWNFLFWIYRLESISYILLNLHIYRRMSDRFCNICLGFDIYVCSAGAGGGAAPGAPRPSVARAGTRTSCGRPGGLCQCWLILHWPCPLGHVWVTWV